MDNSSKQELRWTLLSNYAHVLICLAKNPEMRLRDVAEEVKITERAVQRIVAELESAKIIEKSRHGRRNHYLINRSKMLRHPLEEHCSVGQLLSLILDTKSQ